MKIPDDVLAVLSTLAINQAEHAAAITNGTLDRKLYLKVNQALEALGGKWNRKKKAHLFADDPTQRIEDAILTGEVVLKHKELGFFPTPVELADQLVEMAGVEAGHACLEPSAGTGRIVGALLRRHPSLVVCVERDSVMRHLLTASTTTDRRVNLLDVDDFMLVPVPPARSAQSDRVVMNPPFYKVGLGDHLDHVRHAFAMLRPGGTLVSVLPSSILFREDRRHVEFRNWVRNMGGLIEKLPEHSFKESGTGVNTCTVKIRRLADE